MQGTSPALLYVFLRFKFHLEQKVCRVLWDPAQGQAPGTDPARADSTLGSPLCGFARGTPEESFLARIYVMACVFACLMKFKSL